MSPRVRAGFVTFEGIDGSGKTTVSRLAYESLKKRGERVVLTAEPTKSWLGEAVRRSYEDDVGALAESFLFLADRAFHIGEIKRDLADGNLVLCDRYADSTYAYQGARLDGVVADPIAFLRKVSEPWLLVPDVTVFLRVPAELGMQRIAGRPGKIRFEDVSFLKKVAANYEALARSKGFAVIDGARSAEAVAADALAAIEKRLTSAPRSR